MDKGVSWQNHAKPMSPELRTRIQGANMEVLHALGFRRHGPQPGEGDQGNKSKRLG